MTIQELYQEIGGDYEKAVQIMKSDRLINKYIKKLKDSQVGEMISAAGDSMDSEKLFESAHAMKGVCANLGLTALAEAANEITEEFRPGNARSLSDEAVREKLAAIRQNYQKTVEMIARYETL